MNAPDRLAGLAVEVAERLVGGHVDALELVGGGRNSRVYRVGSAGQTFALKQYPSRAADPRDRLATEREALDLMQRAGIANVPRVLAVDPANGFALLSWLEGLPVGTVGLADIDQAAIFLQEVHRLRGPDLPAPERLASEACLSGVEVERQIGARLRHLLQATPGEPKLHDFLQGSFTPAFGRLTAQAQDRLAAARLDFTGELSQESRSLVPADFGFHNSLRRPDGSLVFFDFEYFGWDDPVKLTADVMLHPGTPVAPALVQRFRRAAASIYGEDPHFGPRLDALYPLFGLRWVLILLNEFLPDRWQRRVHAGAAHGWEEAKERQLTRAQALLTHTEGSDGGRQSGS